MLAVEVRFLRRPERKHSDRFVGDQSRIQHAGHDVRIPLGLLRQFLAEFRRIPFFAKADQKRGEGQKRRALVGILLEQPLGFFEIVLPAVNFHQLPADALIVVGIEPEQIFQFPRGPVEIPFVKIPLCQGVPRPHVGPGVVQSPEIAHILPQFPLQILFADFDGLLQQGDRLVVIRVQIRQLHEGVQMAGIFAKGRFQTLPMRSGRRGFEGLIKQFVGFFFRVGEILIQSRRLPPSRVPSAADRESRPSPPATYPFRTCLDSRGLCFSPLAFCFCFRA